MTYIRKIEKRIKEIISSIGFELEDFKLETSRVKSLGDYQINDAMKLAKQYKKNPKEIAESIAQELAKDRYIKEASVAGPGFINIRLSDEFLIEFGNSLMDDIESNVEVLEPKKIVIDYGGANVAKILHVGHLRSANIGEALKRLARVLGMDIIGDVHLGDSGLQSGQIVLELKNRYPDLICFKSNYNGEKFDLPIKVEDLGEIYPEASRKCKLDEKFKEEASEITLLIQKDHIGYKTLWEKVKRLSLIEIEKMYDKLNATFELFEGELDSFKYIPEMLENFEQQGLTRISDGALVMDIDPKKEEPPIILVKSNGAYIYETTDLGTIVSRVKRFKPDEMWYLTDKRQEFHFKQVFAAAKKGQIISNEVLNFYGFGTMNGEDKKPFKTRDGGVMSLKELLEIIKEKCLNKISDDIKDSKERDLIAETVSIGALKYADLLPVRDTDYVFNPDKFSDLEGKTGPYILYSTIRIGSLISKATEEFNEISIIGETDREIYIKLLEMPRVLLSAYNSMSLNEVCEYLYNLLSAYNTFYGNNHILSEKNKKLQESWLVISEIVEEVSRYLLDILAIEVPEKM